MKIANYSPYLPTPGVARGAQAVAKAEAEFDRFDAQLQGEQWRKVGYFGSALVASQIGAEVLGHSLGVAPKPIGLAVGLGLAGALAALGFYQAHRKTDEVSQLTKDFKLS